MGSRIKSLIQSSSLRSLPAVLLSLALLSCSGMGGLGGGMNPGAMEAGPAAAAKPPDEEGSNSGNTGNIGDPSDEEVNPAWQPVPMVARNDIQGPGVPDGGNTEPMDPGLLSPSVVTNPSYHPHPDQITFERIQDICQFNGQHKFEVDAVYTPYKKKHRARWIRIQDNHWNGHGMIILNSGEYMNIKVPEEGVRRNGGWVYPFSFTINSALGPAWLFRKLTEEDDGPLESLVLNTEADCDVNHCSASHLLSSQMVAMSPPPVPDCARISPPEPVEEIENIPRPVLAPIGY